LARNFIGNVATVYVPTPTTDLQAANKAYVDSKTGGNMAFLAKKEFQGDLKTDESRRTTIGDLATITAGAGKDLYLASAKVNLRTTSATTGYMDVELKINGVIFETITAQFDLGLGGSENRTYQFVSTGFKVAPTEIIKLEVTTMQQTGVIEGVLNCYEVDTGTDPTL